jgi:nucleoside-diphosphate kinase
MENNKPPSGVKEEATLVLVKPDGLKRSLTGNILTRLSETKLRIVACKVTSVSRELAEAHYKALRDKPFFEELIKYLMGEYHTKRVLALVYHGENAIENVRRICGSTNPEEADPVSIRGSYGRITTRGVFENVIHASANAEDAEREIKLWFKPGEIILPQELYPSKEIVTQEKVRVWA